MFDKISLIVGGIIHYALSIVTIFFVQHNKNLWVILVALVIILVSRFLYILNPAKHGIYSFTYKRIPNCSRALIFFECSGYIMLVIALFVCIWKLLNYQ